ncbi:hypothetical protein EVAR_62329_1 [Eumeta japonica]|uniref:Uncharacterized protein n=1 Tax=Eumeta variegata TaxID=151549 RepID=A0A4C1Z7Y8_EUMVA|nr:hypothetical protein EVAR_62329_1 [Eumeta japonica]
MSAPSACVLQEIVAKMNDTVKKRDVVPTSTLESDEKVHHTFVQGHHYARAASAFRDHLKDGLVPHP